MAIRALEEWKPKARRVMVLILPLRPSVLAFVERVRTNSTMPSSSFDRPRNAGEPLEPAFASFVDPLFESAPGDVDLPPVQDGSEPLLEHVASEDRLVRLLGLLQGLGVGVGQIPRPLEQGESSVLKSILLLLGFSRANFLATGLVKCVLDEALEGGF